MDFELDIIEKIIFFLTSTRKFLLTRNTVLEKGDGENELANCMPEVLPSGPR